MRLRPLLFPGVAAIAVLIIALALASHQTTASGARSTTVSGKTASVKVDMYAFTPATLTVKAGTRITFTNHDSTAHTATANVGSFDTGTINPGQSKTIVVKRPGTYPYHCAFHAFMTGTLKVVS
ncbi:MAG TPA: cupredoxin domain-containing protein [Solirubrobacteraceae bacterium]|nr:cupredoxin domain-containing protein [Solirubrobacteraceae bacterium]